MPQLGSMTAQPLLPSSPQRFAEFAARCTATACLLWPFSQLKSGYGACWNGVSVTTAHRYVCEKAHGPAPEGHDAAHSVQCVSRLCVNGSHLRWATRGQNNGDWAAKARASGQPRRNAKLTPDAVRAIRAGASPSVYGVSESHGYALRTGAWWRWLS